MQTTHCQRFRPAAQNRREMLQNLACGFGSVAMAHLFASKAGALESADRHLDAASGLAPKPTHFDPKAMSVIFLYMDGGVSQVDSFDPKPEQLCGGLRIKKNNCQ